MYGYTKPRLFRKHGAWHCQLETKDVNGRPWFQSGTGATPRQAYEMLMEAIWRFPRKHYKPTIALLSAH